MTTTQRSTAVGVFSDPMQADQGVAELKRAGFRADQIGVAGRDWRTQAADKPVKQEESSMAEEGALAGVITGAVGGALVGLGVLSGAIPVVGPAIAAGPLAVILSNTVVGAAVVGLIGALVGLGIPEEEARYYESEFRSGRIIVTVKADERYDEAEALLRRHGATDYASARATAGEEMELRKEVVTGHRTVEVPVKREEVVVERRPVAGQPTAHAADLRSGEDIRVPVEEEQVRVPREDDVNVSTDRK
jgi:hypothetical protein